MKRRRTKARFRRFGVSTISVDTQRETLLKRLIIAIVPWMGVLGFCVNFKQSTDRISLKSCISMRVICLINSSGWISRKSILVGAFFPSVFLNSLGTLILGDITFVTTCSLLLPCRSKVKMLEEMRERIPIVNSSWKDL